MVHVRHGVREMVEPEVVSAIVRLGQMGWGAKRIGRELGVARNTVRRYLAAGGWVPYRQPPRSAVLAGPDVWLRERFLRHWGNWDVVRQELAKLPGAASYEVQATQGDPGVEANWKHAMKTVTCSHIVLEGLTPAQTCWVRMQRIGRHGPGVWTTPASLMVI